MTATTQTVKPFAVVRAINAERLAAHYEQVTADAPHIRTDLDPAAVRETGNTVAVVRRFDEYADAEAFLARRSNPMPGVTYRIDFGV